MINFILNLLDKLPYRSKFGLGLTSELKIIYYQKIGERKHRCLCGGKVRTRGIYPDGWETTCSRCEMLYDED